MKLLFMFYIFFVLFINAAEIVEVEPTVMIGSRLDKLYTWNFRFGRYVPILNRNGQITKRYPGGIYLQKFYGTSATPRYVNVHKPKGANTKQPRVIKNKRKKAVTKKRSRTRKSRGEIISSFDT